MGTLAPQITSTGVVTSSYADILAQLTASFKSIYGTDANLAPDSQDGQWISVLAQGYYDCGQAVLAAYMAFSPNSAQGVGLSSIVKLNGLTRLSATSSTALVTITGTVGTQILNGVIGDNQNLNTQWALPSVVVIPGGGTIDVTATCVTPGAIAAAPNTLVNILTPTLGWATVANANSATQGSPVESDAALRARQATSTALSAITVLQSITAAVAAVAGVQRLAVYENDTDVADGNGVAGHTIYAVVGGGSNVDIANAIALKKSPGTGTAGSTATVVTDPNGVPDTIRYYPLTNVVVSVTINVKALTGFVGTTGSLIAGAVAAFISGLPIGAKCYLNKLLSPANLEGSLAISTSGLTQAQLDALSATFNITSILQSRPSTAPNSVQDVAIAFNEAAVCVAATNITVVVT